MPPTSPLEKPSILVYSSPKPTHPESYTIGEPSVKPQNSVASRLPKAKLAVVMMQDFVQLLDVRLESPVAIMHSTGNAFLAAALCLA
jgi:hypothetical protein